MGLDPGKGKAYVREMLEEFDLEPVKGRVGGPPIPIFNLMFSAKNNLPIYLGMSALFSLLERSLTMLLPNFRPDFAAEASIHATQPGLETGSEYER